MARTLAGTRTAAGTRKGQVNYGTCLVFNGTNTDVTATSQLFYQNTSYSVSFWLKATNVASQRVLCLGSTASNNQVWILEISGKKIKLFIRTDANVDISPASPISTTEVFNAQWNHVVLTDANGTCKVYINSVLDGNNFNYTRSGAFTFNRTGIGALVRASISNFAIGQMDDVRIFNSYVLTQTDIDNLYYKGINPSNPTSWYKFDEGSGTTAIDSGSLAINAVITNATYTTDVPMILRTVT